MRAAFEQRLLARLVLRLLELAGGGALLDVGCGDGLAGRLAGDRLTRYLGLDLEPQTAELPCAARDLRDGLGPLEPRPFDLYLGYYGIASHLSPAELRRLLHDIARHARPGAVVALEALGLSGSSGPGSGHGPPGRTAACPTGLRRTCWSTPGHRPSCSPSSRTRASGR